MGQGSSSTRERKGQRVIAILGVLLWPFNEELSCRPSDLPIREFWPRRAGSSHLATGGAKRKDGDARACPVLFEPSIDLPGGLLERDVKPRLMSPVTTSLPWRTHLSLSTSTTCRHDARAGMPPLPRYALLPAADESRQLLGFPSVALHTLGSSLPSSRPSPCSTPAGPFEGTGGLTLS